MHLKVSILERVIACTALQTLSFSYMTGMIASFHNVQAVLIAAGITALVCVSISVFACQTKV